MAYRLFKFMLWICFCDQISGYRIVPDKYDVIVTAADGVDNLPTTISQTLQGDVNNVSFSLEGKRIWRYEFFAYGCKQHSLGNISISMNIKPYFI